MLSRTGRMIDVVAKDTTIILIELYMYNFSSKFKISLYIDMLHKHRDISTGAASQWSRTNNQTTDW